MRKCKKRKAFLGIGETIIGGLNLGVQASQMAIDAANRQEDINRQNAQINQQQSLQYRQNRENIINDNNSVLDFNNRITTGVMGFRCGGKRNLRRK